MNVAVIGLGYWGPNFIRNFLITPSIKKVLGCDINPERLKFIASRFPSVEVTNDVDFILKHPDIDSIAIATPVATHFHLAKKALENGKNVLVEKPMVTSVKEAEALIELSNKKKLTLCVDYPFIFTGAVRKIKELIDNGEIGNIHYFDSVRINLGLFQHDVNVIWDLASHDISIVRYITSKRMVSVSAIGVAHYSKLEDVAYVTINFEEKLIAHFHLNWLSPVKVRKIFIGGDKKMIIYDDVEPSEKVKVYDKGVEIVSKEDMHHTLIQYRVGDMYAPKLDVIEALTLVCSHFVECINSGKKPINSGEMGLEVVKVLEGAEKSIKNNGRLINLV